MGQIKFNKKNNLFVYIGIKILLTFEQKSAIKVPVVQKDDNSHVGKALISWDTSRKNNASGVNEGSLMLCPTDV